MMVVTRDILKDQSNLKMSANKAENVLKKTESKCSMTLRQKASLKENQSNDTNSKGVVSIQKPKKSVLTENNNNQKSIRSQKLKDCEGSVIKTNSSNSVEKQIPISKKPNKSLKTLKESSKENTNVGIEPFKSLKRKRNNQDNNEVVLSGHKPLKRRNVEKTQTSLPDSKHEIQTTKSFGEISGSTLKSPDLCCKEANTCIEGSSELKAVEMNDDLVKKPNTRSAKMRLSQKKLKDKNIIELDASKLHNLQMDNVKKQAKTLKISSKSEKQVKSGISKEVKSSKSKITAKISRRSNVKSNCKSNVKITNYFYTDVLSETKYSSIPSVSIKNSDHIPVYKKATTSAVAKKFKKYSRVSDVYNMDYDEDLKNSPQILKKKPKKTAKKSKISKPKAVVSNSQPVKKLKNNIRATTSSVKTVNPTAVQVPNKLPSLDNEDGIDVECICSDVLDVTEEPPVHSEGFNHKLTSEESALPCVSGIRKQEPKFMRQKAQFALTTSSPVHSERDPTRFTSETPDQESNQNICQNNMQTFLSDFEASFLRPQMTSTPDNTGPNLQVKKAVITKKHPAVRMLDMTSIPPIESVQKPCFVSDVEFESPEKIDLSEITLFESPTKDEEDQTKETCLKKAGKKCQTKLNFGKSNKTAQKNEREKLTSFLTSTHCNLETEKFSGENSIPKSPQTALREKKKVIPEEIELSEEESDFEEILGTDSDNETAKKSEKEIFFNDLSTSPVKFLDVLKPRKSYSPSVKPSFSRTKKATIPVKKYVSKEEKLIQSMNEHFSGLDSLELCIE